MACTLIRGATVIDGTGAAPRRADVLLVDERISSVGADARADGATVVEAAGRSLLPGLINLHIHLTTTGIWGAAEEPHDVALIRAAASARRHLLGGTTTVRDMGSPGRAGQVVRDAIRSGLLAGPRIVASGRIISPTAQGKGGGRIVADDAAEVKKAARQLVEDEADVYKVVATGAGGTPGSNVGAATYSVAELSTLVEEGKRLGRRIAAHVNGTAGTRNAVTAGVDTLEHLGWMGADGKLDVDERVIAEIKAKDITIVPTMAVWYRPGYDDFASLSREQKMMRAVREDRTASWLAMQRAGIRFATGTDTLDIVTREIELMVRELGLSVLDAIRAATSNAAEALGLASEIGTVAVGKIADLLLVDGDPTTDLGALRRVVQVYRSGMLVVD
ncbi:MAG: amidohydrolase family protein, partial [Chloroflexi bacterium]|nr:amidohydrolase family protein [Chloroflexota bacterium]